MEVEFKQFIVSTVSTFGDSLHNIVKIIWINERENIRTQQRTGLYDTTFD